MPISTVWILKYVHQCYVKWFWTISSLGAPVFSRVASPLFSPTSLGSLEIFVRETGKVNRSYRPSVDGGIYYIQKEYSMRGQLLNLLRWEIKFINSVDETNSPYQCSAKVLRNLAMIKKKNDFFSRGSAKITEKLPPKEKEYKDRLITGYFRVRTNQPSPSFLSCKLENKKNLVASMHQKRMT